MRALISGFGLLRALVPVVYIGGLLYYFFHVSGSVENVEAEGLGPTMIGLSVVGLLFCIPLILKIAKIFAAPRSPGSGSDAPPGDDGFDADAAIARYMAQRAAETAPAVPAARPAYKGGGPAKPIGFGRRGR